MKRQTLLKLIAAALAVLTFSTTVPAQPRINIEPEVLDFGIIPIGQSDELLLTIRNDGEAVLEIEDIAINDEAFTHDWEGEPEFNWEFRESDEFMDFLIIEAELDDEMLVEGDCIGIFTPGGVCGGFARVEEGMFVDRENLGLFAYADDPDTEEIEGFRRGEDISFRIWDSDQHQEHSTDFWIGQQGEQEFIINGFCVVRIFAGGVIRRDNSNLDPGEQFSVTVTFTPDEVREYECELTVLSDDPDQGEYVIELRGTGEGVNNVQFERGWNMISINILPHEEFWAREEGPDILLMTEQLRIDEENHHIILMKDGAGQFYAPPFEFNSIPYWNLTQGYQIKVDEAVLAVWSGEAIPPDADIPLEEGWNLIAYLPTYQLDASAPDFQVLAPIIDHVLIAKDGLGQFLSPAFNFSNMTPWRETQGYQVKVDADVVLNYPQEQDEVAFHAVLADAPVCQIGHWNIDPTSENMSVLITSLKVGQVFLSANGSQIAALSPDGLLVGSGTVNAESRCGLAVWGDDLSTDQIDGLQAGEGFALKLWDAGTETELSVETIQHGAGLVYATDSFTALDLSMQSAIPGDFYLSQAYPNPFNSMTKLSYGLPETGQVSIRVYDLSGRCVETLIDGLQTAGHHSVTWDGCEIASGVYIIKMRSAGFSSVRKVVLVK